METRKRLTSSVEASRASTSPSLAKALASKVLAAVSGSSTCDLFASFDPASSSLRMSQLSLFGDSTSYSVALPKAGTMRSGSLYELPTLARLIGESESSSWHTATSTDAKSSARLNPKTGQTYGEKMARVGPNGTGTLLGSVRMWGTPTVAMTQGGGLTRSGSRSGELLLNGQAKFWGTPTARDWKDGTCADADVPTNGLLGGMAARWPTPAASMPNDTEDPETWLARVELLKANGTNGNGAGMPLAIAAKLHTSSRPVPATTTGGEPTLNDGQTDDLP